MASYTYHYDSGHGWLVITRADLMAVGLSEADITVYSYQTVLTGPDAPLALEEDIDAETFIAAFKRTTGETPRIYEKDDGVRSPIRDWTPFGRK